MYLVGLVTKSQRLQLGRLLSVSCMLKMYMSVDQYPRFSRTAFKGKACAEQTCSCFYACTSLRVMLAKSMLHGLWFMLQDVSHKTVATYFAILSYPLPCSCLITWAQAQSHPPARVPQLPSQSKMLGSKAWFLLF